MATIISALIAGLFSVAGIIISTLINGKKSENTMKIAQAVTDTKIEELTREVRLHNGHAERLARIEARLDLYERKLGKTN